MILKKICLLGDFAVGKTSLVSRFVRKTYSEKYLTTVGVKVDTKIVRFNDSIEIKLVIWDIAGNDEFSRLDNNYLKGSSGIFFVADMTRQDTIGSIISLREEVVTSVGMIPMICAVNKSDLDTKFEVTESDIRLLETKGLRVLRTSAKTGVNVENAFQDLSSLLITE